MRLSLSRACMRAWSHQATCRYLSYYTCNTPISLISYLTVTQAQEEREEREAYEFAAMINYMQEVYADPEARPSLGLDEEEGEGEGRWMCGV